MTRSGALGFGSIVALMLASCADRAVIELPAPPLDARVQSLYVLIETGGRTQLFAVDTDAEASELPAVATESGDASVAFIGSTRPRPDSIPEGEVRRGTGAFATPLSEVLSNDAESWTGTIQRGELTGPTRVDMIPAAAAEFLIDFPSPCPELRPRFVEAGEKLNGTLIELDDTSILVVTEAHVLRATRDGFAVIPEIRGIEPRSGAQLGDGRLVLFGEEDEIVLGGIGSDFEKVAVTGPVDRGAPNWAPPIDDDRVAVLTRDGHVLVFDTRTSTLTELAREPLMQTGGGTNDWARTLTVWPGHVATTYSARSSVERYQVETGRVSSLVPSAGAGVAAATWVDGLGLVAVMAASGRALVSDGDGPFEPIEGDADQVDAFGVGACYAIPFETVSGATLDHRPGFIVAGQEGLILSYVHGYGYCTPQAAGAGTIHKIAVVGEDIVAMDEPRTGARNRVVWLERLR